MPFYEYECQTCKFYTEVMQKITDPPLAKCPSCGKKAAEEAGLRAGVSPEGRRLVRDGLQVATRKTSATSPAPRSEEPKAEAKADSKPETKADAKEATTDAKAGKEAKEAKEAEGGQAAPRPRRGEPAPRAAADAAQPGPRRGLKAKKSKGSRKGRR